MKLLLGDCLEQLKALPDHSVDSIVTDPPYGLSFMGKGWDYDVPTEDVWREALRVLKPGGHLLAFFGTRTYHRGVVRIEDAGFEIRDQMQWIYGQGFPKSLDVSKAIDKAAGAEREVIGKNPNARPISQANYSLDGKSPNFQISVQPITAPATPEAKAWQGWGTALKPANEPIVLARKPVEGTIAANVLKYGVGGLNIDATRIGYKSEADKRLETRGVHIGGAYEHPGGNSFKKSVNKVAAVVHLGRFPANVLFDEEAAAIVNDFAGQDVARFFYLCGQEKIAGADTFVGKKTASKSECLSIAGSGSSTLAQYLMGTISITKMGTRSIMSFPILSASRQCLIGTCTIESEQITSSLTALSIAAVSVVSNTEALIHLSDGQQELIKGIVSLALASDSPIGESATESISTPICGNIENALRAFYVAKASKAERNAGLEGMPEKPIDRYGECGQGSTPQQTPRVTRSETNHHPTVKPVKLMQYLVRLVTPRGGTCLDLFMGSGTTGVACAKEGFDFIGIEREKEYFEIADRRIQSTQTIETEDENSSEQQMEFQA